MSLSTTQQETLSTFMTMTNADVPVAKAFLKATGWDINTAMDRFFAFDGDASKLAPPTNNRQPQQPSVMSQTANLISGAFGAMFGGGQVPQQPQSSNNGNNGNNGNNNNNNGNNNNNNNNNNNIPSIQPQPISQQNASSMLSQTDQDALLAQQLAAQQQQQQQQQQNIPQHPFVRAPDAAFQERLVGPYTNQYGSSIYKQRRDAEQNFAKDWQKGPKNQKSSFLGALFSDPLYKFTGSLEDAKKKGTRENKWVLVNIQDTENFCSHCLNRDIWKDKELGPVVKESFVFYQWVRKTDNAKRVINLYHLSKYPCIIVLDPNTGRQEHEFVVPDSPDKIQQLKPKILEFLDDYPNPKAKPKKIIPKHIPTKLMAPQSHDEQLLQQAIQASLNDNNNNNNNGHKSPMDQDDIDNNNDDNDNNDNNNNNNNNNNINDEEKKQQEPEKEAEPQLDPQPEPNDPNATAIRIRMPNGSILQRLFSRDAKVNQLYIWCTLSLNGQKISLLQTMPRLKLDDKKESTLKELGLIRATLVCSYDD